MSVEIRAINQYPEFKNQQSLNQVIAYVDLLDTNNPVIPENLN
jgi:hypothetical protein